MNKGNSFEGVVTGPGFSTEAEARDFLSNLRDGDVVAPANIPSMTITIDGEEIPLNKIVKIEVISTYGKGIVVPIGDQFVPFIDAEANYFTAEVDSEEEVGEALENLQKAIDEGGEAAGNEAVSNLVRLLTDNGKSVVNNIAEDENDDFQAIAQRVKEAVEAAS